jgi:DNA polymerase I-like protein with 3'-5' exonuclease and polymerase domains
MRIVNYPRRNLVKEILVSCMENACELSVPMSVDANVGKNWFEAKGE